MKNQIINILISILFLIACEDQDEIISFKATSIDIDTNFKKHLKYLDTIILEENDDVIIDNINSIDLCSSGNLLLINAPLTKQLVLYNYKSGKIIKNIQCNSSFSDSVTNSELKPHKFRVRKNKLIENNWIFLSTENFKEYNIPLKDTNYMNNLFVNSIFYKDSIFAKVHVYMPTAYTKPSIETSWFAYEYFIVYDTLLNHIRTIYPEIKIDRWIYPGPFWIDNNIFSVANNGIKTEIFKRYDSLPTVIEYDLYTGKIIANQCFLPNEYETSRIGYDAYWAPLISNNNKNILIAYPLVLSIFNSKNQRLFNLKNLPFSNELGFEFYLRFNNIDFLNNSTHSKEDVFNNLFPIKIKKIITNDDKIYVLLMLEKKGSLKEYILQIYNFDGELMSYYFINDSLNCHLKNILVEEKTNRIILIKKNKSFWFLEICK